MSGNNSASNWYQKRSVTGHLIPEVASAFQKCIRRCEVDDALYWGVDLYLSGFAEYAWKRLRIMVSEDIGPAAPPGFVADFEALYNGYLALKSKKDEKHQPEKIKFVHAVLMLAAAPKSRTVDNANCVHFVMHLDPEMAREIPDCAIDKHTPRGKGRGRGILHFVEVGSVLANERQEPIDLEYAERFRQLCLTRWVSPGETVEGKPAEDDHEQGNLFE